MTTFALEILRSFRNLARSRAFTIPAVAGLAIGIAATTAVFSALSAMLLRSIGFNDPPRIVALWLTDEPHGQQHVEVAYADWREWRKENSTFDDVALASSVNLDYPLSPARNPSMWMAQPSPATSSRCSALRRSPAVSSTMKTTGPERRAASY